MIIILFAWHQILKIGIVLPYQISIAGIPSQ